jgi:fructoselysine-6-P-deglycase FrlB-like protein
MLKEIYEQPRAIADTIAGRILEGQGDVFLDGLKLGDAELQAVEKIFVVACGTSWHAGLVGKFLIEKLARVPVEVDIASEFRYRDPLVTAGTLTVLISQSGETADTLAALREAKGKGGRAVAICNVVESSIARESDGVVYTHAGPEIGVASTKAFTTQLVALFLLALRLGRARGVLSVAECGRLTAALLTLPRKVEETVELDAAIEEVARTFMGARDFLYLGRGNQYPIALEGALKLKEISYIHAEGYPAGEMKHGPIALIDEQLPVVVVATRQRDVREGDLQPRRGAGARRQGHRGHRQPQRRSAGAGRRRAYPAVHHRRVDAGPHRRSAAIARLSHRRPQGDGRRSAEEPGQERDGGVVSAGFAPGIPRGNKLRGWIRWRLGYQNQAMSGYDDPGRFITPGVRQDFIPGPSLGKAKS